MTQLVAIDIDGTLVNSRGEITEETVRTIARAKEHDVHLALCSGRPNFGLLPVLEQLPEGSVEYIVAHNGAFVQEVCTGKVISASYLNREDYMIFHEINQRLNLHLSFYDLEHLCTVNREVNGGMARNILTQRCMLHIIEKPENIPDTNILKLQFLEDDPALIDRLIQEIPDVLYERYYIVRSVIDNLEVMNKEVSKWLGISRLASYLGIPRENTVAVGDEENDRDMLEHAGTSIVMGNAADEIKKLADFVTRSNDEHGVAYALEHVIYKK